MSNIPRRDVLGCPFNLTLCGANCVSTLTNAFNCGECSTKCAGNNSLLAACFDGICISSPTCPSGLLSCGTTCFDVSNDPYNCGSCGTVCIPASNGSPDGLCSTGTCILNTYTITSSATSSMTSSTTSLTTTIRSSTSSSTSPTSSMASPSSRITGGTAAGIGIGCTLLGALLAGLVFFILSRRKRRQANYQQQHLPSDGRERDAVELAGRGITNEQPIVAEPGEGQTLQEKQGVGGAGAGHGIRQKAISKIRGWPGIRDRHIVAELDPHDAVHIPDN